MASVCYYIEEKDVPKVSSNNKNNDLFEYTLDYNNFVEYIDDLIDSFDFDDLKYFLNDLIVEDRNIFRQFMSFKKSFSEEDKKIYEQMLNSILYNEIKFNDNTEFIQELEDFVDVDLMLWYSNESYDFVIFLIEGILIKLATITNISETSQLEDIIDKIDDILSKIERVYNKEYNNQISDIFTEVSENYSDTVFINKFSSLFKKYNLKDNPNGMITLLKKQLEELSDFKKLEKIKEIIKVMKKAKYSNQQIISFLEENLEVEGCEELLSTYYISNGQKDKAIALLRRFCSEGYYNPRSVNALEELKKIYLKDGDDSYVKCIEHEIFMHNIYSEENIQLLKDYYKSDWNIKRNEIIMHYQKHLYDFNLYKFLLNEQKYEEFKNNILNNHSFHELKRYHEVLVERFPDELFETYKDMVEDLLLEAKPKNYIESAEMLKQMMEISGKEDKVFLFIEELKEEYPRRTMMLKEFEKI